MMSDKDNGGPAFAHGDPHHGGDPGMTLRDWFAGQALSGMSANPEIYGKPSTYAADAYKCADEMLAARRKP
jgi:hypothetical protein